jgi:hypothetical protein
MGNQKTTRVVLAPMTALDSVQGIEQMAIFNPDGTPFNSEPKISAPTVVALTDAASIVVDASQGTYFTVTLAGNRTVAAPSNPTDGQHITFEVKQDGTGSRTLSWTSGAGAFTFGAASAPTLTATAGATSVVEFSYSARVGKWLYRNSELGF